MNHKIIKQHKNLFLNREEYVIEIESEANPSFEDAKKSIGKENSDELVIVKKIANKFGRKTFIAEVVVYNSLDAKNNVETIPKKVRKKMQEDAKAAEAAKAQEIKPGVSA